MSNLVKKIRIFVATPGDVTDEIRVLREIVEQLNRGFGADKGFVLELVRWESHSWPAVGTDLQQIINEQLSSYEIFIGIMWKRLGTPTPRAASGTAEEFERALDRWQRKELQHILFYFNQKPFYPDNQTDLEHFSKVLAFRRTLTDRGVLCGNYTSLEEFRNTTHDNLIQVLRTFESPPLERANLSGHWIGSGTDFYIENQSRPIRLDVELHIDSSKSRITATALVGEMERPDLGRDELILTGELYNDEYIQMLYRNKDRTVRQLGVAVLQLEASGQRIRVHYAGFSPERSCFVAGRLILDRQR